jgi:hypothetical protein
MIAQIGIVSGTILEILEKKEKPVNIMDIKIQIDEPMYLIHMALGWLIREGIVRVIEENKACLLVSAETSSPTAF